MMINLWFLMRCPCPCGASEHPAANQAAMGFVKGIAAGTAWGVAAEAMLLEVLHYRRMGQRMIALECQQIIAPARQDPLGNRGLTSHGVQGDNAVRQDQLVQ